MVRRRLTWDETWSRVAFDIAQHSACIIAQIGAVVVTDRNRIVSTGYNGPPANLASEKTLGQTAICEYDCPRSAEWQDVQARAQGYGTCLSVHAEANALLFADRRDVEGGTLYTTAVPCMDCLKLIANSGLARAVIHDDMQPHRPYVDAMRFLKRAGLEVQLSAL